MKGAGRSVHTCPPTPLRFGDDVAGGARDAGEQPPAKRKMLFDEIFPFTMRLLREMHPRNDI